jgi:hypothetical protein
VLDVGNVEVTRDSFRVLAMRAGNSDDARVFTILETGDLRRTRKAGADDSDSYFVCDDLHLDALIKIGRQSNGRF